MSIDELIELVAPPTSPVDAGSFDQISEVEGIVGGALPPDYLAYGMRYGSGGFCNDFIHVPSPFSPDYKKWLNRELYRLKCAAERGDLDEYRTFPDENGLLPWGSDENGNSLYWLTKGQPDEWNVVVQSQDYLAFERWEMPFSTFLAMAFKNQIQIEIWHEQFTKEDLNFTPLPRR